MRTLPNFDKYNLSQFRGYDETIVRSVEDYAKIRTVYGDRYTMIQLARSSLAK